MPAHGLSVNLMPLLTIVSMESGSEENRLCQALTKTLARGRLGLFLEAHFHAPYLQILSLISLSGSQNKDKCVEQESLCRGGRINRSTHTGSDATDLILAIQNPCSLWHPSVDAPNGWKCVFGDVIKWVFTVHTTVCWDKGWGFDMSPSAEWFHTSGYNQLKDNMIGLIKLI